ncbi:hypothetical protein E7T06_09460 [Deinococcus sp. Arct2-2]|uniref:hypothetical protein n=1 Tax=Deinococcus sp. Arct2-2 TaxID=2568653 RepID=UPI0010A576B9|nr:hypothetical protein [Deinococcus sp. Arct2-2]THF69974.1 hypothetical protein E7T06_09460 [Deinococcus sp. Arct2-2]
MKGKERARALKPLKICEWGGSKAVVIPKQVWEYYGIDVDDEFIPMMEPACLSLFPVRRRLLLDLVRGLTPDNQHERSW